MADHIISPDGKFMWTGSEWIPIPQRPSEDSAFVSLQDSVIAGDLSITQNEPEHLGIAIGAMLKELGFNSQGEPSELKTEHKQEIDRMLIITENAEEQGIEFDPDTEMLVGSGALSDGRTHIAERHFKKALKAYREKKERLGESNSLYKLGIIAKKRGNFDESEQLFRNSLYIKVEVGDRIGEIAVLSSLVDIAEEKEEPGDLKKLHRDIIDIAREIGDWDAVSHHLGSLISLAKKHNDDDETEVLLKEGLVIDRKHGRKSHELWNLRDLTILVVKKGNLDEAENIARELINLDIKVYGHSGLLCNDYDVLIDIVKKRGNIDEAISLIRKKIAISKKRGEPEFMPHMGAYDLEKILRLTEKRGNLDEVKRLKKEISLTRKKESDVAQRLSRKWSEIGATNAMYDLKDNPNLDKDEELCKKDLAIVREFGYREGELTLLENLRKIAMKRNDLNMAESLGQQILLIIRESDAGGDFFALSKLGVIAFKLGNYKKSERLFRECISNARERGDRVRELDSLLNLSKVVEVSGNLDEIEKVYQERLDFMSKDKNRIGESEILKQFGELAEKREDLDAAERQYRKCIAIMREIGDRNGEQDIITKLKELTEKRESLS